MTRGTERSILSQCAPTLAGVKAGSLVKFDSEVCDSALGILRSFESMDVGTKVLRSAGSYLCLVYRRDMLSCVLSDPGVRSFLEGMGYPPGFCDSDALDLLAQRMSEGMQHEIGIFLGYPLRDVEGFLENGGRNYKRIGCWKVYGDVDEAESMFRRIRAARDEVMRLMDSAPLSAAV